MNFNELKTAILKENNILFCENNYRFVDHTNKLATTGFKTKSALIRNKNIIRVDRYTLKIMRDRYLVMYKK